MTVERHLIGTTIKVSWVSSGTSPSAINAAVYDGAEALVDSGAMTDSGSGLWYYLHTVPNSPGYYAVQTNATVAGRPYKNRTRYQAVLDQVD